MKRTIQPITEIARITREREILLHTDAAQSAGKIPTKVAEFGVDLFSIAGHKLYGPKGVGVLYIRRGVQVEPLMHGAGHESGRRAGTENVVFDLALCAACALAAVDLDLRAPRLARLRDHLHAGLNESFGDHMHLNGHPTERLPNTPNVGFVGRARSDVLAALGGVAASTGAACHGGRRQMSPVVRAMGVPETVGIGGVGFSLGRWTTTEEIHHAPGLFRSDWFAELRNTITPERVK